MIIFCFKIISVVIWFIAIPISVSYLATRIPFLQKIPPVKQMVRWVTNQLLAADRAGRDKRGASNKPREMSGFWMGMWGFTLPLLVLLAIFPWAIADLKVLLLMPFFIVIMIPLARFIENIVWLLLGYARFDNDDDNGGGSETIPPADPPPFGGLSAPWPERRRGQKANIDRRNHRSRSRKKEKQPSFTPY